jgi:hypothetical protein
MKPLSEKELGRLSTKERHAAERGTARGADNLMDLVEYHFAKRPRILRRLRKDYLRLCIHLYLAIDRDWQRRLRSEQRK